MKKKSFFGVFAIVLVMLVSSVSAKSGPNRLINTDDIKISLLNADELKADSSAKALVMLYYREYSRIVPEDAINHKDGTITHYNAVSVKIDYILDTITIDRLYKNCRQQIAEAYSFGVSRLKDVNTETERKYLGFWEIDDIHDQSVDFIYISNAGKIRALPNDKYLHEEGYNYSLFLWWLALCVVFSAGIFFNSKTDVNKDDRLEDLSITLFIVFFVLWLIVLFSASWPLALVLAVIIVYYDYIQRKKEKAKAWAEKQNEEAEAFKTLHSEDNI